MGITELIVIGGVGGLIAGFTVWGVQELKNYVIECRDKKQVYKTLIEHQAYGWKWSTTKYIASRSNLTMDRTNYICSIHDNITLSLGDREVWEIVD